MAEPGPVRDSAARLRIRDLPYGWRYILGHAALRPLFFNTIAVGALARRAHDGPPALRALVVRPGLRRPLPRRPDRRPAVSQARGAVRGGTRSCSPPARRAFFPVGLAFIGPGVAGLIEVMAIELGLITAIGVFNPVVDCLFVTLAQQDQPRTRVTLERTFAAAQAKRVRRAPALWARFAELTGATRPLAPATVGAALLAATCQAESPSASCSFHGRRASWGG